MKTETKTVVIELDKTDIRALKCMATVFLATGRNDLQVMAAEFNIVDDHEKTAALARQIQNL
jgi:hypothetical protein